MLDLVFADMTGDGRPEALTTAGDDARLAVHYNRGGLYLSPDVISVIDPDATVSGTEPVDIAAGDYNNDTLADLAVIGLTSGVGGDDPDSLIMLEGTATGVSATPVFIDLPAGPNGLIMQDIAGDPADDVAVTYIGGFIAPEGVSLSLGVVGGLLGAPSLTTFNGLPAGVAALDVNDDNIPDLAVLRIREGGAKTAGISIFTVAADGTTTYRGDLLLGSDNVLDRDSRLPHALTAADMDGDGRQDLVAVTWNTFGGFARSSA